MYDGAVNMTTIREDMLMLRMEGYGECHYNEDGYLISLNIGTTGPHNGSPLGLSTRAAAAAATAAAAFLILLRLLLLLLAQLIQLVLPIASGACCCC